MSDIQAEYGTKGLTVLGGTIDQTGMAALQEFVQRYHPMFPIGAVAPGLMGVFGQYGPQTRLLVPMVVLVDQAGVIRGQFMGSDSLFEGDKMGNLRAAINHMMGFGGASKPTASTPVKKTSVAVKK